MSSWSPFGSFVKRALVATAIAAVAHSFGVGEADAQNCASMNPVDWPAPAKPYFMVIFDTSGSMNCCTTPAVAGCAATASTVYRCDSSLPGYALNSCGMVPSRLNDGKCAMRKTVQAFAGEVNFGLATYARTLSSCGNGTCASGQAGSDCVGTNGLNCNPENYGCSVSGSDSCGAFPGCTGAGNTPRPSPPNFAEDTWRNGANIVVPLLQDSWWLPPPPPASNVSELLSWFDESCVGNRELFADGATPIAASLRGVTQYLRSGWDVWSTNDYCTNNPFQYGTPLDASDRSCRNINVLLVTDGDESCDSQAQAVAAATDLHTNGVTIGSKNWPVRVHVINFAGGSTANTNAIAAAGGTTASISATNEATLAKALSDIIGSAVAPEDCNNGDDNCNGCVDEGYVHYCNHDQSCCNWSTQAQRQTCLTDYQNSLNSMPPNGDLTKLPCTSAVQATESANWLCYNPGDECDNIDNNCSLGIDEGATKCGPTNHCPQPEICDTFDDDCDGVVDDGGVCGSCNPSPEICDGCDNDCDGVADEGIAPVACGFSPPANCAGTISCRPPQNVPIGGCVAGGGYNTCTAAPQTEVCDTVDNDCDGVPDDNIAPVPCVPVGTPNNLVYGGTSQCRRGTMPCGSNVCSGFIGPSTEICDGIDNDCDGTVDESPVGVGQQCGVNFPPCTPGLTACVNGALVCQGGTGPQPEVCDGVDNNCNGTADEAPLADAPAPGMNKCWNRPGVGCSFPNPDPPGGPPPLQWAPPPGGTCQGLGSLTMPCNTGTLACAGASGWVCQGGTLPVAEVCDGVDNNCSGVTDEGNFPTEGQVCGNSTPPCITGLIDCQNGVLDCVGDVGPQPEVCNGIDDNCDTLIDNGLQVGGACNVPYDMNDYPGVRTFAPCQPGVLQCDGMGGTICVGGIGPSPEVCDSVDNDCDGTPDETGPAPDGIDGTDNPDPPPDAAIGDACGTDEGTCTEGSYACINGQFQCTQGQGPQVEVCDCSDNDCNGTVDNENPNNDPPLCGEGKDCVESRGNCQCAAPCGSGEFECPAGQDCVEVTSSETGESLGRHCLVNTCPSCGTATVKDVNDNILCAPEGTEGEDCKEIPECVCKGASGCQSPCFGVTCDAPLVCASIGPQAGQCVPDTCLNLGCPGCGQVCNDVGQCLENPCTEDSCPPAGQPNLTVCKPSNDFLTFTCFASCAEVNCKTGEVCEDGECIPDCVPPCEAGETCVTSADPPVCVNNLCTPDSCPNGGCCEPTSGACGSCPCEGVVCPDGEECKDGECALGMGGEGGGGGNGGGGPEGGGGATNTGASSSQGGDSSDGPTDNNVWGLATGGGGCACQMGETSNDRSSIGLLLGALALAATRRRRQSSGRSGQGGAR